jgi:L-ribulose-5-phosphate 3-epimerase UlaE
MGFAGPFVVEMWNEDLEDAPAIAASARRWLVAKHDAARQA